MRKMAYEYEIVRATAGPKHHLFGFHDLIAFNQTGEKLLSLEADVINRPPLAGESFGVGYSLWEEKRFIRLGETTAMNYPQGARQQWLSNHEFIVNNKVGNNWGADIYDVNIGKRISSISSPAHCVTKDGEYAFGINYARLFRLGGYGYNGLEDITKDEVAPKKDGIFKTDLKKNHTELLISIEDVARIDPSTTSFNGFHHYVTHLCLSPDNKRIAFLHRFFLADGGIRTRLMTVGTNGEDCRCIACGFLSHFDWKDNKTLFIWGKAGGSIDSLRSNPLLSNRFIRPILGVVKSVIRNMSGKSLTSMKHFLMVRDSEQKNIHPFAIGVIDEDGHPMCSPTDRNIIICDTYPNRNTRKRTLFFYDFNENRRTDVGMFYMGNESVNRALENEYLKDLDPQIKNMVTPELLSFTRSGLHCDLHPRWDAQGTMIAFDSIHEGTRQIYIVKK